MLILPENSIVCVIAAHPDDEVLGCGGTIARMAAQGHQVHVAILGEGITSRFENGEQVSADMLHTLQTQSRQAHQLLGTTNLSYHQFPDNRFDELPLHEVIKIVEKTIKELKPRAIFTHYCGDLNIDHQIVHRAVLTATRPTPDCSVQQLLTFETPSSTEWAFHQFHQSFRPSVFVDISSTLESKVSAMEVYESEIRCFPHPRSPEALRAIARRWGSVVGRDAAEAFELIRAVQ